MEIDGRDRVIGVPQIDERDDLVDRLGVCAELNRRSSNCMGVRTQMAQLPRALPMQWNTTAIDATELQTPTYAIAKIQPHMHW